MKMEMIIFIFSINECVSINGIIWSRKIQEFTPIFNIEPFKSLKMKIHEESRQYEVHNFKGQNFYFVYFNVINNKMDNTWRKYSFFQESSYLFRIILFSDFTITIRKLQGSPVIFGLYYQNIWILRESKKFILTTRNFIKLNL